MLKNGIKIGIFIRFMERDYIRLMAKYHWRGERERVSVVNVENSIGKSQIYKLSTAITKFKPSRFD